MIESNQVNIIIRNIVCGKRKEIVQMSTEFNSVVVTDIKLPFGSMVVFMIKWAIETIPAIIPLTLIGSLTFGILNVILGGLHHKIFM